MACVFDLDGALERVEGDREFLRELAGIYLEEVSMLMSEVSRAIGERDLATATKLAHRIKGASSNFCAQSVCDAACQLEQIQALSSVDEIEAAHDKLRQESERLSQAIRSEFKI